MASGNGYAVGVEVDGVRYPSARAADLALGLPPNTVCHRAHSRNYPTYRWLGETPGRRPVRRPEDRRTNGTINRGER
mgnify:CR=1 FL=1